ncbi:hypothetical protein CCY99_06280 [Helicobacter sp. 16-1353]|uniref:hypothetical protein n=1 Tax=Helicobacter sp. 16-1353 TaxID=2004996 RepID=UPI000DCDB884|nr:hypothetical protein [Helicobacter sp. 16-1353]RAX53195.1 hypothetical protein CCY99_06280 [Helicobacter sp. 16-1353]
MNAERRDTIIKQLEQHNKTNIKSLNDDELEKLFKQTMAEWTRGFIAYNSKEKHIKNINLDEMEQDIKKEISNTENLYNVFYTLLQKYPYDSIRDIVINNISDNIIEKSLFMLEIKYREYQEILLDSIENRINFMPKEEAISFIDFIETKRDETGLLKDILSQLQDTKIALSIDRITNTKKYIISHFLPQDLESNYKRFFTSSKDKQELIARLREISNAYSKKELDDMTKEDLMDILTSIRQKEVDEKKDKEDFEKYINLFKKALYEDNNDVFNALVVQVIEDVSSECLYNLKVYLRNEDPLFENKFQAAQKEWNKFK